MKKYKYLFLLLEVVFCFFGSMSVEAHNNLKIQFYVREIEEKSLSDKEILPLCDSIVTYAGLKNDTTTMCLYLLKKGNCFSSNDKMQYAIQTFHQVVSMVDGLSSPSDTLLSLQNQARIQCVKALRMLELYDISMEKCYELLEHQSDPQALLFGNSFLAINFAESSDTLQAKRHISIADSIIEQVASISPDVLSDYYNHRAGVFFFTNKPDSALKYLEKGLNHVKEFPDYARLKNIFDTNMAAVYWSLKEYDLAKRCYRRNLESLKESDIMTYLRRTYYYAELCYDIHQVDSAFHYCKEVVDLSVTVSKGCDVYGTSRILYSNLLYKMGKYKESRDYYIQGQKRLDSLNQIKGNEKMAIMSGEMIGKKEAENKSMLAALHRMEGKCRVYGILLGVLLAGLVLLMCYFRREYRRLQAKQRQLHRELTNRDSQIAYLDDVCKSHLQIKEDQSNVLVKALMAFHDSYLLMENKISVIQNHLSDPERVRELVDDLSACITETKEKSVLDSFNLYFNSQYADFHHHLHNCDIVLSKNEWLLCMLLCVDMSTKDVAFYMKKSVRTIETMIYKLRKKFEIPSDVKTPDFFKRFVNGAHISDSLPADS